MCEQLTPVGSCMNLVCFPWYLRQSALLPNIQVEPYFLVFSGQPGQVGNAEDRIKAWEIFKDRMSLYFTVAITADTQNLDPIILIDFGFSVSDVNVCGLVVKD